MRFKLTIKMRNAVTELKLTFRHVRILDFASGLTSYCASDQFQEKESMVHLWL